MTAKSIKSLNSLNAVYQYLVQQELIEQSIPRDVALTLIAPVSSLALAIDTVLPHHQGPLKILILAQHPLAGMSHGLFYNLLPHLADKYATDVMVTVAQEGKQLQTPYDTESKKLLKADIVHSVKSLPEQTCDYDFVFWPSPNNVSHCDTSMFSQAAKQAIRDNVPIITTHHSNFDRIAESMAVNSAGIRIEEPLSFRKKKNPFSVHTDDDTWGLYWGQMQPMEESNIEPNRIKLCTQVLRHICASTPINHKPGEMGYASNHTKYPIRRLLCDYAVNTKDWSIYKTSDSESTRFGSLNTELQAVLSQKDTFNEESLLAAIELVMACGLPFGTSENDQISIESILEAASQTGSPYATLALGAYAERRNNIPKAREIYARNPEDAYCSYHMACIDYEKNRKFEAAISGLHKAAQGGLPCASVTLHDIAGLEPEAKSTLEKEGVLLGALIHDSAQKGDPAALKIVAREHAAVQELDRAEEALYRAAVQGDNEAVSMIIDLYQHFKSTNQMTSTRKKRLKLFKQFLVKKQ